MRQYQYSSLILAAFFGISLAALSHIHHLRNYNALNKKRMEAPQRSQNPPLVMKKAQQTWEREMTDFAKQNPIRSWSLIRFEGQKNFLIEVRLSAQTDLPILNLIDHFEKTLPGQIHLKALTLENASTPDNYQVQGLVRLRWEVAP